jgi:hypothetical protein
MVQDKYLINVLYWNASGIQKKLDELFHFMLTNHIHIACINETFLKPHSKISIHPEFRMYRLDRLNQDKGGVAIIIRKNISHKILSQKKMSQLEVISVEITLQNNSKIIISSAYMPGGAQSKANEMVNDIKKLVRESKSFLICGDFNARHRHWNCSRANQNGTALYKEYCRNNFLIKIPKTHTRFPAQSSQLPSTIDLTITNGMHETSELICHPMNSDHNAVTFSVLSDSCTDRVSERMTLDYKNADWDRYRGLIHYHLPNDMTNRELISESEIDSQINEFTKLITHARDKSIPLSSHNKYRLILSEEIIQKIKYKNNLRKQWQRNRIPAIKTVVNKLEKEIACEIKQLKNENYGFMLADIKPSNQSVWTVARKLKSSNKIIPPLKDNGNVLLTSQQKCDAISNVFSNNHENPLSHDNPLFTSIVGSKVLSFLSNSTENDDIEPTDEEEVTGIIKGLKNPKAPGIDRVNNRLIKKLPSRAIKMIVNITNACIRQSYFPSQWKLAKVVPIPKPCKDLSSPSSYRPISLLCSLSKIIERVILSRINAHLDDNNIIPPEQYGFRQKFSTTRQLVRIIEESKNSINNKNSTGLVMLDVEKAFDRVWHDGLVYKMIELQFPSYIIRLVNSFLRERSFFVEIAGNQSKINAIPFGVPQGAVLSPTLYNIFTYDIPKCENTSLALFADDTAFFTSSPRVKEIEDSLKEHAVIIENYMRRWKITINKDKTKAIYMTKRIKKEIPKKHLKIFNTKVKWETEAKYLGFMLDKRLTFKSHIDYVISRTNNAIRILYPLLARKSKLNVQIKLLVYKLAIRPIFTYACPAFLGIAQTHIKKLQIVQNKTLRMILNKRWFERTTTVHEEAKLPLVLSYIHKLRTKFEESFVNN